MTTPTTKAMPMEMGKAMASPAMSMAATSSKLARLKTTPPSMAETMLEVSAKRTLFRKLLASWPVLPMVNARITEIRKMPTA